MIVRRMTYFTFYLNYITMQLTQEEIFDSDEVSRMKSRLGVRFFFVYSLFYAGFILIGVFNYELLSKELISGINLAIIYGFWLIVLAVVMGILYNFYCTRYEDRAYSEYQNNQNKKEVQS